MRRLYDQPRRVTLMIRGFPRMFSAKRSLSSARSSICTTACTLSLLLHMALLIIVSPSVAADTIERLVRDDRGQEVHLSSPAKRIVSLAPHVTEMLFSAGAGDKIVGAVSYSDFPEAAKAIPQIGSYQNFDFERITALQPDLIVGWISGNPTAKIQRLESLGFTVYLTEPRNFAEIASNIERLAVLTDTSRVAHQAVEPFRTELKNLSRHYQDAVPVTLFYEIWNSPLMTLNGDHLFNAVAEICGGKNVFADLPTLAPRIDVEAVLQSNPQVIIASGMNTERPEWLDEWRRWPELRAAKNNHLYFIPPDFLQRHSLRILEGARQLCGYLDQVRESNAGNAAKP